MSGGWGLGWSVYGRGGECCGGPDCWCVGLSGRGDCSGGARWDVCCCVSSGCRGAVYCDDVCRGESRSCVCLHLG